MIWFFIYDVQRSLFFARCFACDAQWSLFLYDCLHLEFKNMIFYIVFCIWCSQTWFFVWFLQVVTGQSVHPHMILRRSSYNIRTTLTWSSYDYQVTLRWSSDDPHMILRLPLNDPQMTFLSSYVFLLTGPDNFKIDFWEKMKIEVCGPESNFLNFWLKQNRFSGYEYPEKR